MSEGPPLAREIIRRKRDREALTAAAIRAAVDGITDGTWSDAQVAAFAMAVCIRGMSRAETVALTRAMAESGERLRWDDLNGPCVDKHSTGGVGDKVSLVLAPLVAACGAYVPMISGRGLGHTGGTLDKLAAIPGYRSAPSRDVLRRTVAQAGCAIVGATDELAPADRRLYAIRDVTATVESQSLIVASILSKKLAAGVGALVMDVKTGSGAFAADEDDARRLARTLVAVACDAGLPTRALITGMDQVLGRCAGNALEVAEAARFLRGDARDPRLEAVVFALGTCMMELAGLAASGDAARSMLGRALELGEAAERFARMVAALGGPADFLEDPQRYLDRAPIQRPVLAPGTGIIARVDVRALGNAVVQLGGGRRTASDAVDPAVGLSEVLGVGELADPGRPLAVVHARNDNAAQAAARSVTAAYHIGTPMPAPGPVVHEEISACA